MTVLDLSRSAAGLATAGPHPLTQLRAGPAQVLTLLSLLFGTLVIVLTPPLRGPDEAAHFLRAYGIAQGEIVPSTRDHEGRKGILLPARIHYGFAHYEATQAKERKAFGSRAAVALHDGRHGVPGDPAPQLGKGSGPVFVLYEGSEGYAPVAYLPHVTAALVARLAGLDFAGTLYLMRFAGLAALTAVVAYAAVLVPFLGWAFVAIAMLPAALYGRAVISADGVALACTMMMTALCLRGAVMAREESAQRDALWMALCLMSKPPHLAFVLLSLLTRRFRDLPRHWRSIALIALPGVLAALGWLAVSSGDVAAWRLVELTGRPAHEFDPLWKLAFMLEQPSHFPRAVLATFAGADELWRQLIGVLGLFDAPLLPWIYPALTAVLVVVLVAPMDVTAELRQRLAIVASLTVLSYGAAVFLIFYLVWTPVDAQQVWGVQGRYFVPALPALAILVAALVRRGPAPATLAAVAIFGAILSGASAVEAIVRAGWPVL